MLIDSAQMIPTKKAIRVLGPCSSYLQFACHRYHYKIYCGYKMQQKWVTTSRILLQLNDRMWDRRIWMKIKFNIMQKKNTNANGAKIKASRRTMEEIMRRSANDYDVVIASDVLFLCCYYCSYCCCYCFAPLEPMSTYWDVSSTNRVILEVNIWIEPRIKYIRIWQKYNAKSRQSCCIIERIRSLS